MKNDCYTQLETIVHLPTIKEERTIDPYGYNLLGLTPIERTLRALEKSGVGHVTFCSGKATGRLKAVLEKAQPWNMTFSFMEMDGQEAVFKSYQLVPPMKGLLLCKEPLVIDPRLIDLLVQKGETEGDDIWTTPNKLLSYCPPAFFGTVLPHLKKSPVLPPSS